MELKFANKRKEMPRKTLLIELYGIEITESRGLRSRRPLLIELYGIEMERLEGISNVSAYF